MDGRIGLVLLLCLSVAQSGLCAGQVPAGVLLGNVREPAN
jgi:hypothetical protein